MQWPPTSPGVNPRECEHEYGIRPIERLDAGAYDLVVLAVAHRQFRELGVDGVRRLCADTHVLYDIKHVFRAQDVDGRL